MIEVVFIMKNFSYRDSEDDGSISVVEETVWIDKNAIDTGRVRVRTVVDEEQVVLRDELTRDAVDVERVAIGREIDVTPKVREEGDILIVPVVEERLVVEKRLFLVEELRIHRSTTTSQVELPATRRVMRAVVERDKINFEMKEPT